MSSPIQSGDEATWTTALDPASPIPDEVWENNPTADIYPSIVLCGRPLALQVANALRAEKRTTKKFAVTFVEEKRPGDHDQWKPPHDFCKNFSSEFVKQFRGSTVAFPSSKRKAKPESTREILEPLEIKLSFKPEDKSADNPAAGEISARWTTPGNTRAVAAIDFADKPWLVDFDKYNAKRKLTHYVLVNAPRNATSPAEATALAMEDAVASCNCPIANNQVLDRFPQKLSLPYGELYRESILVDQTIPQSSGGITYQAPGTHPNDRPTGLADLLSSLTPAKGLVLITIGLIAIGWISNMLTQGYYRQNINYAVVAGVAAMLGLMGLVLMMTQF